MLATESRTVAGLFKEKLAPDSQQLARDYVEYIRDNLNFSPVTVRNRKYSLTIYLKHLKGADITLVTNRDVDTFFRKRSHTLQQSSLNADRAAIRDFFRYLEKYREIPVKVDYSMIRYARLGDPSTDFVGSADLRDIINKFDNNQDRLILYTFFYAGLRISELCALKVADINNREIHLKGKGGKRRVIPIPEELDEALQDFILDNNIRTGTVFRHQVPKSTLPNTAYTPSGLRKRLQRNLAKYGIKLRPHWLRHGIATELHMNGMDIRDLQVFLGHSRIETTQRYAHVTSPHLKDVYGKYAPPVRINIKVLDE